MPKVSIIIPVYGVENYIEQCARSLFEQTLDDIEYLFIDDCTPDNSMNVLKEVLEEYPYRKTQVVIHRMPQNSGQAAVRKWGMSNATGNYVIHCDSDDWVDTRLYEDMYKKALDVNADIIFCDFIIEGGPNNQKHLYRDVNSFSKDKLMKSILTTSSLNSLCAALVRRDLIHNIDFPIGNQSEDKTMMIQICWNSMSFKSINKSFYHYRDVPTSITNAVSQDKIESRAKQIFENIDLILSFLTRKGLIEKYKKYIRSYIFSLKGIYYPVIVDPIYYERWKNTYKKETQGWLFDPFISFKFKVATLLLLYKSYIIRRNNDKNKIRS